ncbi:MAG TPA: hypothetical protein VJA47_02495 [archaeon]|nr:hypothetical protein [archaeon]
MQTTLEQLQEEVAEVKREVHEIKELLIHEPELREDVIKQIKQARKEIKTKFVTHEETMKEFAK